MTMDAPVTSAAPPDQDHTLSVLIVEDNVDAAESMAMLLRQAGHRVQIAFDGKSALEADIDSHPDVALIDIGLPDIDGRTVAQQLRHKVDGRRPLLIAITGHDQDVSKSLEAGIDLHLAKPADPVALLRTLNRFSYTIREHNAAK